MAGTQPAVEPAGDAQPEAVAEHSCKVGHGCGGCLTDLAPPEGMANGTTAGSQGEIGRHARDCKTWPSTAQRKESSGPRPGASFLRVALCFCSTQAVSVSPRGNLRHSPRPHKARLPLARARPEPVWEMPKEAAATSERQGRGGWLQGLPAAAPLVPQHPTPLALAAVTDPGAA